LEKLLTLVLEVWGNRIGQDPSHIVVLLLQYEPKNQATKRRPTFISSTRAGPITCSLQLVVLHSCYASKCKWAPKP